MLIINVWGKFKNKANIYLAHCNLKHYKYWELKFFFLLFTKTIWTVFAFFSSQIYETKQVSFLCPGKSSCSSLSLDQLPAF